MVLSRCASRIIKNSSSSSSSSSSSISSISSSRLFWSLARGALNLNKNIDDSFKHDNITILDNNNTNPNITIKWVVNSDKDYGGLSQCNFHLNTNDNNNNSTSTTSSSLVFNGSLHFTEECADTTKANGGFCALRGFLKEPLDLRDYEGLDLKIRNTSNDRQIITLTSTFTSIFEGDMYQLSLDLPPKKWCRFHVPFSIFRLTANGRERETQRSNDSLQLETIGFLIKCSINENPKDFIFDIDHIIAMTSLDNRLINMKLVEQKII